MSAIASFKTPTDRHKSRPFNCWLSSVKIYSGYRIIRGTNVLMVFKPLV